MRLRQPSVGEAGEEQEFSSTHRRCPFLLDPDEFSLSRHPSELITPIRIVAAVVVDAAGRLLLVRKRGTEAFMQPGGKRERGETDLDALSRELKEELGINLDATSARPLGSTRAPAANEPGRVVEAKLYLVPLTTNVNCGGEIDESIWLHPRDVGRLSLAPLTRDVVVPAVARALARPARASKRSASE